MAGAFDITVIFPLTTNSNSFPYGMPISCRFCEGQAMTGGKEMMKTKEG